MRSRCRAAAGSIPAGADSRAFLQGYGEASFGIGDTLLSLLPFRAQAIAQEIAASRHRDAVTVRQRPVGDYPLSDIWRPILIVCAPSSNGIDSPP
ncbi:hypothetical protein I553_7896 [Mycobacterium xenopi 4042]|uniref:Uncharacterized protein n=1 Tax=Mycobacterium xenopi 4042 TaxID=1299334 RepID=X8APE0_MYCXE|nr:hypothetical protein I553_7896 [Mycobacterium xenopi 4042]